MSVKILIDSASDIDAEEAKALGISLISMEVRFGEETFSDGLNLSHREFFEKLIESAELPETSQVNPYTFEERFKQLVDEGNEVVAITISSKLSGTYRNAVKAAEKFAGKVFVVDSLNACIGERILCQYALKLASDGSGAAQIAEKLNEAKGKINLIAVLGTLKYLKKGGRISAFTAFAGEMLSIKPVIGIVNGEVKLIGKAVGSKKGNNLLNSLAEKKGIDFDMPYGVVWSGLEDSVLKKYVEDSSHLWKGKTDSVPSYMIGSAIGTHIGPGGVGVAFFEK